MDSEVKVEKKRRGWKKPVRIIARVLLGFVLFLIVFDALMGGSLYKNVMKNLVSILMLVSASMMGDD